MPIVAAPAVVAALAAIVAALAYVLLREMFKTIATNMPGLLGLVRDAFNAIADWVGARIEGVISPVAALGQNIATHLDNARAVAEGIGFRIWSFAWSVPNVMIPRAIGGVTSWAAQEWQRAIDFVQAVRGELHGRIDAVTAWADARVQGAFDSLATWTRDLWTGIEHRIDGVIDWTNARVDAARGEVIGWVAGTVVPDLMRWVGQHVGALTAAIAGTRVIAEAAQATATATAQCLPRCGSPLSDLLQDLDDDGLDSLGYLAAAVLGLMAVPHLAEAVSRIERKMPDLVAATGRIIRP